MNKPANPNKAARRLQIQTLALALALIAPFGLFWALSAGLTALAVLFFALIVAGMLLTLWKG